MLRKVSICILLVSLLAWIPARAVSARSAVVIDGETGEVLFEQNADERMPMASTTKIMTALVALEEGDLDRSYKVKKEYTLVEGSSMYLREGETLTMRDTLYGLMLASGNDAALAVAGECGGFDAFVEKMNAKAKALGLENTHFDNPNGLDSETHYTTAHELAKIAAAAMQNDDFRQIVSTRNYTAGEHVMANHNRLLSLYEDAVGVKTGFTKRSGRCLVSAAERNGRRLVAVTLNAPDDWNDHMTMLENAFAQYVPITLHHAGDVLTHRKVFGGDAEEVPLIAQHELTAWVTPTEQEKIEHMFYGAQICYAPIVYTAIGGRVEYRVGDKVLAEDQLLYGGAVMLPQEDKNLRDRLLEWLSTKRA